VGKCKGVSCKNRADPISKCGTKEMKEEEALSNTFKGASCRQGKNGLAFQS